MLVMFMICFLGNFLYLRINKTETSSLSSAIACIPNMKPLTSIFTEDILDSIPIKPKAKLPKDKTKGGRGDGEKVKKQKVAGSKIKETPTLPFEPPEIDGSESDDVERIRGPETIVEETREGDIIPDGIIVPSNGAPTVTPTTERDSDIDDTTITSEGSQNLNNGTLQIRIIRI